MSDAAALAAQRVAKLNAKLAAEGKIPAIPTAAPVSHSAQQAPISYSDDKFLKEIEINDSPQRLTLIKRQIQADIEKETNTSITTKGRYIPPSAFQDPSTAGERPLYLVIRASTQPALNEAAKRIDMIMNADRYKPFEDRMQIGIDSLPGFDIKSKILGPDGSYIKHIETTTGARVQLRGRGSGFVESFGEESREVRKDYESHKTTLAQAPPPPMPSPQQAPMQGYPPYGVPYGGYSPASAYGAPPPHQPPSYGPPQPYPTYQQGSYPAYPPQAPYYPQGPPPNPPPSNTYAPLMPTPPAYGNSYAYSSVPPPSFAPPRPPMQQPEISSTAIPPPPSRKFVEKGAPPADDDSNTRSRRDDDDEGVDSLGKRRKD